MSAGTRSRIRPVAALIAVAVGLAVLIWLQPSGLYPWFKALHVIAIISWMAGMLYLPRLFIYHCAAKPGSEQSETFKVMEGRSRSRRYTAHRSLRSAPASIWSSVH